MKTTPRWLLLPPLLALVSCSTLQDQIPADQPHAVIRFPGRSPASTALAVLSLDGQSVAHDRDYRIRPGSHHLVVESTARSMQSGPLPYIGAPVPYGNSGPAELSLPADGGYSTRNVDPFTSMQPVLVNVEERKRSKKTMPITVEAGWRYEHNGLILTRVARLP